MSKKIAYILATLTLLNLLLFCLTFWKSSAGAKYESVMLTIKKGESIVKYEMEYEDMGRPYIHAYLDNGDGMIYNIPYIDDVYVDSEFKVVAHADVVQITSTSAILYVEDINIDEDRTYKVNYLVSSE